MKRQELKKELYKQTQKTIEKDAIYSQHALKNHVMARILCVSRLLFPLKKYHRTHVIMKIGRTSAPGTNSNTDTIPIHRNIKRQATIPATSSTSPITGTANTATIYSLMSKTKQRMSASNSTLLKTKYPGTAFNWPQPSGNCVALLIREHVYY
ncbi:MAG: hypothetical protein NWE78_08670 [Candidatus Bathyarchaeota archaeon]|nr:hypothetical protein [Candidatus Bathyarchaeota archaeon]